MEGKGRTIHLESMKTKPSERERMFGLALQRLRVCRKKAVVIIDGIIDEIDGRVRGLRQTRNSSVKFLSREALLEPKEGCVIGDPTDAKRVHCHLLT